MRTHVRTFILLYWYIYCSGYNPRKAAVKCRHRASLRSVENATEGRYSRSPAGIRYRAAVL